MKKANILKFIVSYQIIIIIIICEIIYQKKQISITPINKSNLQFIQTSELKHFWNLNPNETATWSASFLPKPVVNHYNNDGLNDTQNYSIDKPNNTYRIIALGDSFTYGQNVETKDNWTEILERKLNEKKICQNIDKFEILNLGVPGYDLQYSLERFRLIGNKYNSNLVIWTLVDLNRLNEEKTEYYNQCLAEKKYDDQTCWSKSVKYIKFQYNQQYIFDKQISVLKQFRQLYSNPILFIDFYGNHQPIISNVPNSMAINRMYSKKNIIKDHPDSEVFFPDSHPNKTGHQIFSNIVFTQLLSSNQIDCQPIQ